MLEQVAIISVAGFLAAAVDAIAGGGGLISLPALLLAGIPPHLALGTNKFASSIGTSASTLTFARSGKVNWELVKWFVPFTFLGAALGVVSVLRIEPDALNRIVPVLIIAVGLYTVLKRNVGLESRYQKPKRAHILSGCVFAAALGFYDGFFGPGTGSFLIFAFISVYHFNFVEASANAKVLNLTSNMASLLMFALNGKIALPYGIPMALFMVLGARCGAQLAIHNGARFIKPIFIAMSLLVAVKMVYQS